MEFATKIRKVANFCTEVIHFKLKALLANICIAVASIIFNHYLHATPPSDPEGKNWYMYCLYQAFFR